VNVKRARSVLLQKRERNVVCVQNEELLVLALAVNIITNRSKRVEMITLGKRAEKKRESDLDLLSKYY